MINNTIKNMIISSISSIVFIGTVYVNENYLKDKLDNNIIKVEEIIWDKNDIVKKSQNIYCVEKSSTKKCFSYSEERKEFIPLNLN